MNNLRCSTFGFQETFCPTFKIKDLPIIIELFGKEEENIIYPSSMDVKIMGCNLHIHKYKLYHIYGGLYIINLESIDNKVLTMAFIDKNKIDKELFEDKELSNNVPFLFDFESIKEKFKKGEDILDVDLKEYVCPLELMYIFLSNYFIFLFHVLNYNFNQFNDAIESNKLSSIAYVDTQHIKNFMLDDLSLNKLDSLAESRDWSDIHEELVNTLDYIFKNKNPTSLLRGNSSYILKNPIKEVYGLVNKSLLNDKEINAVHFLNEEDALSLFKRWNIEYSESMWDVSGKEKYLKEMDAFVGITLLYRGLLNLEYSLACMGKTVIGESIGRFQAWKIKRKVKRCM